MKKYIKPVMESESFVANEYIGACWTITCHGQCKVGSFVTTDTTLYEDITKSQSSGNNYIYTGTLKDKEASQCESFTQNSDKPDWVTGWRLELLYELLVWIFGQRQDTVYYHPVSVEQKGVSNGPNAS